MFGSDIIALSFSSGGREKARDVSRVNSLSRALNKRWFLCGECVFLAPFPREEKKVLGEKINSKTSYFLGTSEHHV